MPEHDELVTQLDACTANWAMSWVWWRHEESEYFEAVSSIVGTFATQPKVFSPSLSDTPGLRCG